MAHVIPQVALHRVIWQGMQIVKQNPAVLNDIFQYYTVEPINRDYGVKYIDNIKKWFLETEIPVVQAWSLNPQQAPQIAIKLASEQEDESKAAIGDHWDMGEEADVGVSPFVVNLDVLIMAPKNSDESLWLYYIVNYILFKRKRQAERLGLQLQTFSATDNLRDNSKMADNVWVRTIRFRCVVQNFWDASPYLDIGDIEVDLFASSDSTDIEVDI
jgi:hypothetical protein